MLVIEKKVALMTKNVGLSRQKRALVLAKKRGPVSKVIDIESERGLREPRRATKNTHRARPPLLELSMHGRSDLNCELDTIPSMLGPVKTALAWQKNTSPHIYKAPLCRI